MDAISLCSAGVGSRSRGVARMGSQRTGCLCCLDCEDSCLIECTFAQAADGMVSRDAFYVLDAVRGNVCNAALQTFLERRGVRTRHRGSHLKSPRRAKPRGRPQAPDACASLRQSPAPTANSPTHIASQQAGSRSPPPSCLPSPPCQSLALTTSASRSSPKSRQTRCTEPCGPTSGPTRWPLSQARGHQHERRRPARSSSTWRWPR